MSLKWFNRPFIFFNIPCNRDLLKSEAAVNSFLDELVEKRQTVLSTTTRKEIDEEIKWLKQNRQDKS